MMAVEAVLTTTGRTPTSTSTSSTGSATTTKNSNNSSNANKTSKDKKSNTSQESITGHTNNTNSNNNNNNNMSNRYALAISSIVHDLIAAYESGSECNFTKLKGDAAKKYKLQGIPKMADILQAIPSGSSVGGGSSAFSGDGGSSTSTSNPTSSSSSTTMIDYRKVLHPYLKTKPVRTASGVAVVAVMSKPHRCPHIAMTGNVCVYCPGGPDSDFEYSTQAYTGYEPTSMRAIRARYDPYSQTKGRVAQLRAIGHVVDKVEFIVMGGTFLSLDTEYKDYFIRNLHDALSGHHSSSVEEAIQYSEQSTTKCIGITIETRPDYCLKPHLNEMLKYGCTRIEVGVQSIYESVARETNRGHTVAAVCHSFALAKDCGYKVVTHMMPDLPNMGMERDLEGMKEYFENPMFRSDGMKVYPTLVIRGTGLYELWKTGRYRNYTPSQLVELTAHILALIPPWTRLYRIQRDIPMPLVSSGVEHGNLRELAMAKLQNDWNIPCLDIRSREVGMKQIHSSVSPEQVELLRRDYMANGGWETFISYEDPNQDILIGLLRLRQINMEQAFRPEIVGSITMNTTTKTSTTSTINNTNNKDEDATISSQQDHPQQCQLRCSMIRELHVYGTAVAVNARDPTRFQHQGFGILLMEEAERIAKEEHGSNKLLVISGVGTRHYYRKLGFTLDGPYMSKMI